MLNIIRNKIIRILKALGASGITKIVLIVILLVFMTLVYASSNARNISLETFEETLKSKSNMTGMKKCTNRQLMQFMNLDYNSYDSFLYYRSKDAMSADELLIIKAYKKMIYRSSRMLSMHGLRAGSRPLRDMHRIRSICSTTP